MSPFSSLDDHEWRPFWFSLSNISKLLNVGVGKGGLLFIVSTTVCKTMYMVVGDFTAQETAWKLYDQEWILINLVIG